MTNKETFKQRVLGLSKENKIRLFFYLFTLLNGLVILIFSFSPRLHFYHLTYLIMSLVASAVFLLEYIFNIVTRKKKLRYIFSFSGLVQVVSIIPFLHPGVIAFRLLKVLANMNTYELVVQENKGEVKRRRQLIDVIKKEKVILIKSFTILIVIMVFLAFAVFSFENPAQPDKFQNIFDAVWWSFQTGSTVGYGDIVPITVPGRLTAMVLSILGIMSFSIPTTVISTEFISRYHKRQGENKIETDELGKIITYYKEGYLTEDEFIKLKKGILKEKDNKQEIKEHL